MKTIYKPFLTLLALFAFLPAMAQVNHANIGTQKSVSGPDVNGVYTLTMEQFIRPKAVTLVIGESVPVDVVMVLDLSGSMEDSLNIGTFDTWAEMKPYLDTDYGATWGVYYFQRSNGGYEMSYNSTDGNWWYRRSSNHSNTGVINESIFTQFDLGNNVMIKSIDVQKIAVLNFVRIVKENAESAQEGNPDFQNRISIVKFASARYYSTNHLLEGDHMYRDYFWYPYYNYTELVKNMTDVVTGYSTLRNAIIALKEGGATASDYGMTIAKEVIDQPTVKNKMSRKAVIMVTDGEPTHGSAWSTTVANNTILKSKEIKATLDDYNHVPVVYCFGIFTNTNLDIRRYLNATSSNSQYATVYTQGDTNVGGYYQKAATATELKSMFETMANDVGSNRGGVPANGTTLVKDVITEGFQLPAGTVASDILVYTCNATGNYGSDNPTWSTTLTPITTGITKTIQVNPDGTTTVEVSGYDFSAHWVGEANPPSPQKLVIKVPIVPKADFVGGANVPTNVSTASGLYYNNQHAPVYTLENYPTPTLNFPVNITIRKTGLAVGESATFKITKNTGTDESPIWDDYTTVMITGTGNAANDIVKLANLEAATYKIEEGSWSYTYKPTDGSKTVYNTKEDPISPYVFSNEKKTTITIKHAEGVKRNVFNP